jgi:phosphoserine phosphatase RsbU/P
MLRLHIHPAQGQPFEHLLEEESLVVGRATSAGLSLADPFLSRHHSRLFRRGDRYFVEDLGSRNGTLVNGREISEPSEISPGDVLEISASTIRISRAELSGRWRSGTPDPDAEEAPELSDATTVYRGASEVLDRPTPASEGEEALLRYAERLKILNAVHLALGRPIALEALLELILDRVADHLHPERAMIFLKQPDGTMQRAATRSVGKKEEAFVLSRSLSREVAEKGLAALVLDAQTDSRFSSAQSILISGVRSIAAAPLLDGQGGPTLGMIVLASSGRRIWSS